MRRFGIKGFAELGLPGRDMGVMALYEAIADTRIHHCRGH